MSELISSPPPPFKTQLEAIMIEEKSKPYIVLRDGEGILPEPIVLSPAAYMLASLFDGKRTIAEIQGVLSKETGQLIQVQEIQKLATDLEQANFLDTKQLQEKRQKIWGAYLASPVREMRFSGTVYPTETLDLAGRFGGYFKAATGPQKEIKGTPTQAAPPLGIVSPHIDFNRGGPAYAWTYQELSDYPPPDVIVALGVAHQSPPSPWVFTKKDFATPYGPLRLDEDLFHQLKGALWYDPCTDEWVHRLEHSLEFQALWLKYLWKEKAPAWVPILCSSFYGYCSDRAPSAIETLNSGLEKMSEILRRLESQGKKVMILMSVDLAHVGTAFGDEMKVDKDLRDKIEKEDRESFSLALQGEADGMYLSFINDNFWRKVCGLASIYSGLRLMKGLQKKVSGKLLTYGQSEDPRGGIVSFAGAVFPRVST